MIVVLIGYMASGKSTIGRQLASKLGFSFIDLDSYIEEQELLSISDIFNKKGEIYFRKKESEYLNEIINGEQNNIVLSLGGGTPCYADNIALLLNDKSILTIYLKVGLDEIVNRLGNEKYKRPLVAHIETREDLKDFIRKHLFERSLYYEQSNIKIHTDHNSAKEVVEKIILQLY
ncbi:shikimate kinase [Ichthyenterobacterium sp. W332]|uniref:Shikimate kinase n=1 Tax=Microcosmobacter mediterraneus TaxID=3075607 RepID=A0ABU2YMR6_9FLAO|nr:shikimate kinase [Ichthyenterobacterium sp. W332]MDT0559458.1 shikimate kinase [Ichthyenterobacterium sp. W332]